MAQKRRQTSLILDEALSDEELSYKEKLKGFDTKGMSQLIAEFTY